MSISVDNYFERNPMLLYIGKKIVEEVLDKTNEACISEVNNPRMDILKRKLESFSPDQLCIIQELIP